MFDMAVTAAYCNITSFSALVVCAKRNHNNNIYVFDGSDVRQRRGSHFRATAWGAAHVSDTDMRVVSVYRHKNFPYIFKKHADSYRRWRR